MTLAELHNLSYEIVMFGYLGIYIYFISIDQLTPIPNEISLITIGFLCSKGNFNPFIAGVVSLAGFISIDLIYFFLIKAGTKWSEKVSKKLEHSLTQKITVRLKNNFPKTIFILCFIPRMRFFGPIISSMLKVPVKKFIVYDAASLSLFTAFYITIGFYFHRSLKSLLSEMEEVQNILFISVLAVLTVLIIFYVRKFRRSHEH
jgi:membrane protein DedA with SNARE-associated domain